MRAPRWEKTMSDPLTRALAHAADGTPTDEDAAILAAEVERGLVLALAAMGHAWGRRAG